MATKEKKPTYADYGYVKAFLDAHPDVKAKVDAAIKGGWTEARLEGEIRTTKWWKTRNASQRQWDVLSIEQPEEAARLIREKVSTLRTMASRMGLNLTDTQLENFAKMGVRDGRSDQELQVSLANRITLSNEDKGKPQAGQAGTAIDELRQMASEYGVTITDHNLLKWTREIVGGQRDPAELADTFRESAKALYPPLADMLDKGQTVKGFVSPYLDIASKQLGLMPDQMDLTDSKWTGMISGGAILSADEWTKKIRTDSAYGWNQTDGAKREAMAFVSTLGSIFGGV